MEQMQIKELLFIFIIQIVFIHSVQAQHTPLNPNNPVNFHGDYIIYQQDTIVLGPRTFYIDGQLTADEASKYPFVYHSVNEATKHLTDGTEDSPMVLYIAPYVYWIDDPDDPEVRVPKPGNRLPFGLEIDCEWLTFYGLTEDPQHVVLACNRGQTMGAKGNFTMLNIKGEGTRAENVTFGNYCNIDLQYPLKPELNREKRGSAIVQAQLVFCDGDKLLARNTHFISRLNLCPFVGSGKRVLFDGCHFECTDDALNATAVYLNCTFEFYSSKPFYYTRHTGAVLLNCDITSFTKGDQYFTKVGGQLAVIDTRFHSETVDYIGWRANPDNEARNYQHHVTLNSKPVQIGSKHPASTVVLDREQPLLNAYCFRYNGDTVYNTFNLLKGDDNWDPMHIENVVREAEQNNNEKYTDIPVQLLISSTRDTIETNKNDLTLTTTFKEFGNYPATSQKVQWRIEPDYESLVDLNITLDGDCQVIPTNQTDELQKVIVTASTQEGLEAASVVYVLPEVLEAPDFKSWPVIKHTDEGILKVDYKLNSDYTDESLVTWYRCTDAKGSNPIKVAVSRFQKPEKEYKLSQGDIGYYIMASIAPKHKISHMGQRASVLTQTPVTTSDVDVNPKRMEVDFENMSTSRQPKIIPGFWTLDTHKPADTKEWGWEPNHQADPWYYGTGENGAANDTGIVQATKGARMLYTPVGKGFGDMKLSFTAVPAKTAGQGFSSAKSQYMDIYIKLDTKTMNGYALRLIRTTKYSNAIDFMLMKYSNGKAIPITEPVSASCYRDKCYITLEIINNQFTAHAKNPIDYPDRDNQPDVVEEVNLKEDIQLNNFGGFGFQHTGSVGTGATLIKDLVVEWD